jgi:hypothetical protein
VPGQPIDLQLRSAAATTTPVIGAPGQLDNQQLRPAATSAQATPVIGASGHQPLQIEMHPKGQVQKSTGGIKRNAACTFSVIYFSVPCLLFSHVGQIKAFLNGWISICRFLVNVLRTKQYIHRIRSIDLSQLLDKSIYPNFFIIPTFHVNSTYSKIYA